MRNRKNMTKATENTEATANTAETAETEATANTAETAETEATETEATETETETETEATATVPFTEQDILTFLDSLCVVGAKSVVGPRARISVLYPLLVASDAALVAHIGSALGGRNATTKPVKGRDGNSFLVIPTPDEITSTVVSVESYLATEPKDRKALTGKEWSVARTNAVLRAGFPVRLLVTTVIKHGHTRQGACAGDEPTSPRTVRESGLYQTAE